MWPQGTTLATSDEFRNATSPLTNSGGRKVNFSSLRLLQILRLTKISRTRLIGSEGPNSRQGQREGLTLYSRSSRARGAMVCIANNTTSGQSLEPLSLSRPCIVRGMDGGDDQCIVSTVAARMRTTREIVDQRSTAHAFRSRAKIYMASSTRTRTVARERTALHVVALVSLRMILRTSSAHRRR